VAPLQSLRLQDELVCGVDNNGVLVVPVSLDYAIWTATVAQRVDGLAHVPVDDPTIKSVQIYTDGQASERVKTELRSINDISADLGCRGGGKSGDLGPSKLIEHLPEPVFLAGLGLGNDCFVRGRRGPLHVSMGP